MHNPTRFITLKRCLSTLAAAVLTFPLANISAPSHAKPPAHAPAYGYGNGNSDKKEKGGFRGRRNRGGGRDSNRDYGVYDRDRDRNGDNYDDRYDDDEGDYRNGGARERRTYEGTVTRDLSGSRFQLRATDGQLITVRLRRDEPQRLSVGDRVRVSGTLRRDYQDRNGADFVADRLQILSNVGGDYGSGNGTARRVSFPATVLDRDGSRRLTVRGDNGRTYTVESRYDIIRVDDGDRVRIEGLSRGSVVTAATVSLLRDSDNPIFDGRDREFLGRVTRVDTLQDVIVVRDDSTGRTYTFRPRQAEDFRVGQRVRATLDVRNGRSTVTRVERL
jgi:outer membrane lipoprotein SlyB